MAEIAASVLDADFSKWKQWLPELEKAGIKRIQWDVMDNRFVPNKGIDKKFFAELRPRTKAFFESHLMVLEPEKYIREFAELGSQMLIFHVEATEKPLKIIEMVEEHGMKAGIAINNETGAEKIFPYLDKVDLALVMGVQAGFGGQKFNPEALEKISALRKKIDEEELPCEIEVDGGINTETAKKAVEAGVDILVAGTGIFKHPKGISEAVKELMSG